MALTLDAAVVAGTAAARLHGIDVPGTGQPAVDVLHVGGKRPGGRPLKSSGIRQRYAWLPDDGVLVEHGMRVTTIGRTLRDGCAFEGLVAGVIAIDSVRRRMPDVPLGRWRERCFRRYWSSGRWCGCRGWPSGRRCDRPGGPRCARWAECEVSLTVATRSACGNVCEMRKFLAFDGSRSGNDGRSVT